MEPDWPDLLICLESAFYGVYGSSTFSEKGLFARPPEKCNKLIHIPDQDDKHGLSLFCHEQQDRPVSMKHWL